MAPTRKQCRWSSTEDEILMRHVHVQGKFNFNARDTGPRDWNAVAAKIIDRSNKDCRKRWLKLSEHTRKGEWHIDEDEQLRKAVRLYGYRWVQVAKHVESRSADQCASRWQNYLDPNIKRQAWTEEEDLRLLGAYELYGSNWKTIQVHELPRRALQDLRNRHRCISKFYGVSGPSWRASSKLAANHSQDRHNSIAPSCEPNQKYCLIGQPLSQQAASDATTHIFETPSEYNSEDGTQSESFEPSRSGMAPSYEMNGNNIFSWNESDTVTDPPVALEYNFQWPSEGYSSQATRRIHDGDGYIGGVMTTNAFTFHGSTMHTLNSLIHTLTASKTTSTTEFSNS
nr:Myb-like transcriptional factor [Trichoderma rhododendri]